MTITYSAARMIYGLSSDTKPTNVPVSSIFYETDTRSYFMYDGTYWLAAAFGELPDKRKWGTYTGSNATGGDGILNGNLSSIVVGTGSNATGTGTGGFFVTHDTGATINSLAGVRQSVRRYTRLNNAYFKASFRTDSSTVANTRIFCGMVSSASAPASAADPLNALEGVALWYDAGVSANWRRRHNDSSGASVSDDTSVAVAANTKYTVEIFAVTDSKFVFNFNGTYTDISTDIPASTSILAFWIYIENTTGASRTIQSNYAIVRGDI